MLFASKEKLSNSQMAMAKELVNLSLTKATEAMEKMLKIRVNPTILNLGSGSFPKINELDNLGRFKVHLLKVKFNGDIAGSFYFVINTHEVDLINEVSLPRNLNATKASESKVIKHDFMAEIENLIASLAVSEIADFLGVQIISEVPEVMVMQGDQVNDYLIKQSIFFNARFYVTSVLGGKAVNISPYFIWMLDNRFINELRLNVVE